MSVRILDRLFKTRIDVSETTEGTRFTIHSPSLYLVYVIIFTGGAFATFGENKRIPLPVDFDTLWNGETLFVVLILSCFVWTLLNSLFPIILNLQNETLRLEHKIAGVRMRQQTFSISEISKMQVKEIIGARGTSYFDVALLYQGNEVRLKLHLSKFAAEKLLFELYQRTLAKASSRQ